MLSSAQIAGINKDAEGGDGIVGSLGRVGTSGDAAGCAVGALDTPAATGEGNGVPKAGTAGATEEAAVVYRFFNTPSSRKAKTAERAANVFATFLLE